MLSMKWLRRLIRRNMKPIEVSSAHKWKQRLSIAYMLIAWNTFGMIAYGWYTGRGDWADYYGLKSEEEKMMPNNEYFARTLGRPGNTMLVKMKGFTVVETKDFDYVKEKEKENQEKEETKPKNTIGYMHQNVSQRQLLASENDNLTREQENTLQS